MDPMTSPAVSIIAQMVSPALLLVATSSLLGLVMGRFSRVVEHVRKLSPLDAYTPSIDELELLRLLKKRVSHGQDALLCYFVALTSFAATCLFICVDHLQNGTIFWLPVSTAVLGVILLAAGTAFLIVETRVAARQISQEMDSIECRLKSS